MLNPSDDAMAVCEFNRCFQISEEKSDRALLTAILKAFSAFPYENVSKIIKNSRESDEMERIRRPEEVLNDHLDYRLGGTCFSLTYMLDCILRYHGFHCYPVSADMRYGAEIHCALVVSLDGHHYLIDPGYCITAPLLLHRSTPVHYRTPADGIRLRFSQNGDIDLYTFDKISEKWRYRFRDAPLSYERFLRNWLHSFSLNSMNALCLNKMENGVMTYVHRTTLRRTAGGEVSKINAGNGLHALIQKHFGIAPRFVEEAAAALPDLHNGRLQ